MSPRIDPWVEISTKDKQSYLKLAKEHTPAIRQDPKDLWINLRVRVRAAILEKQYRGEHIARIQMALHYLWDEPTKEDLKKLRPKWVKATVNRWHERFVQHVNQWGPGDVELVRLILQRRPTGVDLDIIEPREFFIHEIRYRTGAHIKGVLRQIKKGDWDKAGNIQVWYELPETPFEMMGSRPVLTVDSSHHSFYRPGEVPEKQMKWRVNALKDVTYFSKKEWRHYKIETKDRGAEPWEIS